MYIQSLVTAADSFGGRTPTYVNLTPNGWSCSIEPMSGRELEVAAQQQSHATMVITIRWFGGLGSKTHRFVEVESGRVFNIAEPPRNSGERNRELVCYCTEDT